MRRIYGWVGLSALLSFALGCSGSAGFSTSEKINGRDPSAATYPIFGKSATVEDGVSLSAVVLMASNHPDLCSELEKQKGGLEGFFTDAQDPTMVANIFIKEGDFPKSGETFSDEILVSMFFVFHNEKPVVLAINDGLGTISFDKLSDAGLSGSLSTNLIYEATKEQDIDVQLVGSFQRASRCKALDDLFDDDVIRQQVQRLVEARHSAS